VRGWVWCRFPVKRHQVVAVGMKHDGGHIDDDPRTVAHLVFSFPCNAYAGGARAPSPGNRSGRGRFTYHESIRSGRKPTASAATQ
jgi:hypothetical protein